MAETIFDHVSGSVNSEIDALSSNSLNINNLAIITGTLNSSSADTGVQFDYPNGFTYNNCVILSVMIQYAGSWYQNDPTHQILAVLASTKIKIFSRTSGDKSCPFKVMIYKYTNI